MLRGPQTAAELRLNAERLHRFADISSVEGFLDELAAKDPPRALRLPRAPGSREARWAHLLCGDVALPEPGASPAAIAGEVGPGEIAALKAELSRQSAEVAALRAQVERLARELGVDPSA
jgi:hypothetical protein